LPVPRLPGHAQQSIYVALPFPGCSPEEHRGNPERGELPVVQALHDAVQPAVPAAHPHTSVLAGHGAMDTVGLSHFGGLGFA
jgi:hypothetical protein